MYRLLSQRMSGSSTLTNSSTRRGCNALRFFMCSVSVALLIAVYGSILHDAIHSNDQVVKQVKVQEILIKTIIAYICLDVWLWTCTISHIRMWKRYDDNSSRRESAMMILTGVFTLMAWIFTSLFYVNVYFTTYVHHRTDLKHKYRIVLDTISVLNYVFLIFMMIAGIIVGLRRACLNRRYRNRPLLNTSTQHETLPQYKPTLENTDDILKSEVVK